jgi:transcriptional regulator with XRE-family HTH domain
MNVLTRPGPGVALRTLRTLAGLSLAEAAEAAQTSRTYLARLESGTEVAPATFVARVTGAIADRMVANA